mgnify:CR=1 FL=1
MSETKPGMPSPALTEEGVRRVMIEVLKLQEKIDELSDQFNNGVKYVEEGNYYVLVWTQKELDDAKKEADEIYNALVKPQATPTDQEGQDDTQAGSVDSIQDSVTAD